MYLALWEAGQKDPQIEHAAGAAVRALSRFAGTFPIGRPAAATFRGLYESLRGRPRRASRTWAYGLDWARRLELPYETSRLAYEIGRHLAPGDPARATHLQQAADRFGQMGAIFELEATQATQAALRRADGQTKDARAG